MGREICVVAMRTVTIPLLRPWRWHFTADRIAGGPWAIMAASPRFRAHTTVTKRTFSRVAAIQPPPMAAALAALTALTQRPTAEGWEPTADDRDVLRPWYYRRFQRATCTSSAWRVRHGPGRLAR